MRSVLSLNTAGTHQDGGQCLVGTITEEKRLNAAMAGRDVRVFRSEVPLDSPHHAPDLVAVLLEIEARVRDLVRL
jgi:hypothetical protein